VKKNKKTIDYYMDLKYDVVLREITDEDGLYFKAFTKELDPIAFYGAGETPEEALKSFEVTKKDLFEIYLENGYEINEPEPEEDDFYSGKFIVRTSPITHRRLVHEAKKRKKSLNSLICETLEVYLAKGDFVDLAKNELLKFMKFHESQHQSWRSDSPIQPTSRIEDISPTNRVRRVAV
jgi:antitoxin HicB